MLSDIQIAQAATLRPIIELARERLSIPEDQLEPYGRFKAKVSLPHLASLAGRPDGKLILVSGINPTPAGEGKTTTTVGLVDALNRIGKRAIVCLREPSIGPVFGMKGGAAGGGHAQVVPMEDINLHFTGDFHAVALAHNLLAALIDNHIHHGNALGIDLRRITWRRVMDMNDRALRDITVGLGGPGNGYPRQDGFDIVVASEVMAILCLATSLADLKERLGRIVIGSTREQRPITAAMLQAQGAMTALLRHAIEPNLVQTLENNPAFIHGGPFANIAHGCNSVIATRAALKLGDYAVTEAGFGADLGAEKFIDIKCRLAGLRPDAVVLVASVRALKYQGGADVKSLAQEDLGRLERGIVNLERHLNNVRRWWWRAIGPKAGAAPRRLRARSCASSNRPRPTCALSMTMRRRCGKRPKPWRRRSTARPASPPMRRCASSCNASKTRATAAARCASPRRSIRSPPIRNCAARPKAMCSTSAKCAWPPAPASSCSCAATS